ncbi:MAG: UDP-N-acetyl glucosamine 2-epimerase [Candidatus Omnitrophica bacterium]|nr:UDP-N-acetyl glucosamine 2-epimerase [Candidatus Omnitrophota bacterium]
MIHIAIGTKAQFIKMAPIMQELTSRGVEFNLIDLGQHALLTSNLREEFNLKDPDVCLSNGVNISKLFQGIFWIAKIFLKGLNSRWVKEKVFRSQKGICLIHGDTVSTLLALYLAKRVGIKVAHVEAGLRSYNCFEPFPEEITRIIAMKFSDVLFAPCEWAAKNLEKMKLDKKVVRTGGNTSYESLQYSLKKQVDLGVKVDKFALITVHRMENIFSKRKLQFVIDLVKRIAAKRAVVFVRHPPTINRLKKFKLDEQLAEIENVYFFKIVSHAHFVNLLNKSEFIITDGGSIQEEAYYLDKPCILLRKCTERIEGLGENVMLSEISNKAIDSFLQNYQTMHRKTNLDGAVSPSREIADYLESLSWK